MTQNAVPAADPSVGLVSNPGFEQGLSGWTNPSGVSNYLITTDAANVHSGTQALQISGPKGNWSSELLSAPITVAPSTAYTLSYWVKAPVDNRVGVYLKDAQATNGAGINTNGSVISSKPGTWQQVQVPFTTGASTKSIVVCIDQNGYNNIADSGSYYFDDFALGGTAAAAPAVPSSTPSQPGSSTAVLPLSDPSDAGQWTLNTAFSDEFNSGSLDKTKWNNPTPEWEGNWGVYTFSADNANLSNNQLVLANKMTGNTWTTGNVTSKQKTLYGYYETRARSTMMSSTCSFWFQDKQTETEIDVFELFGRATLAGAAGMGDVQMATHFWSQGWPNPAIDWGTTYKSNQDLAAGYHTYGLDWRADTISYYFDGKLIAQTPNKYFYYPQNIVFDTEIFPDWEGSPTQAQYNQKLTNPDGSTRDPSACNIDYVRAWTSPQNG